MDLMALEAPGGDYAMLKTINLLWIIPLSAFAGGFFWLVIFVRSILDRGVSVRRMRSEHGEHGENDKG